MYCFENCSNLLYILLLKSVHFKKTVAQSSFLSKVLSFSLTLFWFQHFWKKWGLRNWTANERTLFEIFSYFKIVSYKTILGAYVKCLYCLTVKVSLSDSDWIILTTEWTQALDNFWDIGSKKWVPNKREGHNKCVRLID